MQKSLKLDVFTTVGDIETANWIKKLKPSAWKISASLLTHIPLLEHIASFQEPIYLSTGLSTNKEIDYAVSILKKKKRKIIACFIALANILLLQQKLIYHALII